MSELTITEKTLITGYQNEFYFRTGKKIQISVLDEWESLCRIEGTMPLTTLTTLICEALNTTMDDVFVAQKKDDLVIKRGVIFFILSKNAISNQKIAQLSNRNNSHIHYALKGFSVRLEYDHTAVELLKNAMKFIKDTINSVTIN